MNVSLTPELEQFVYDKVKSGRYLSASEVICEALRLLEERDCEMPSVADSIIEIRLEELQKQANTDSEQENSEELIYGEEIFTELWDDIRQNYPGNKSN
ncbi:MAG TPA: type II toxin-antitoxin system ParD family antitoxin [Nostocaceae cyanobacterium]|nr:type II toxin-antitoxin system ParD family antitoxin [Nostocaceae cyanobacterium]